MTRQFPSLAVCYAQCTNHYVKRERKESATSCVRSDYRLARLWSRMMEKGHGAFGAQCDYYRTDCFAALWKAKLLSLISRNVAQEMPREIFDVIGNSVRNVISRFWISLELRLLAVIARYWLRTFRRRAQIFDQRVQRAFVPELQSIRKAMGHEIWRHPRDAALRNNWKSLRREARKSERLQREIFFCLMKWKIAGKFTLFWVLKAERITGCCHCSDVMKN